MPLNFRKLLKETQVSVTYDDPAGIKLEIITPEFRISSVEEDDISFYQELWCDSEVMEKFAAGKVRLYSGSEDEKNTKAAQGQAPDYAKWRIADWQNSWLTRRQANNIWHGLTVFDSENKRIGHIVLGGGELAYFLVKDEWGKGYMSIAAAALVRIAVPYIALNHPSIDMPDEINATVRTVDHQLY